MENTLEKEQFIKENNIQDLKTLVRVNSDNYKNAGGYYGSSNGWIGKVKLGGYVSSSMHEKLYVSFGNGENSWQYFPHELEIVTIQDLELMEDKNKSFQLLMRSSFIKLKSSYFLENLVRENLIDWSLKDDVLTVKAAPSINNDVFTISVENK
ncbi:hypothetical protein [Chryseobacterium sp. MYb328]|uniref:hypothetical protein n=1 Tax=Chryseobacterium sp. MYb328 TaxID=2745231 RepID=UPI0030A7F4A4